MNVRKQRIAQTALAVVALTLPVPSAVRADEGGVSFWAAGQFSSRRREFYR